MEDTEAPRGLWRIIADILPEASVGFITILGGLLALYGAEGLPCVGSICPPTVAGFDTGREIGVGFLTGGLIGGTLLLIDERRESRRDKHDARLNVIQRRHALAVALATKNNLQKIVLSGQDLQEIVLSGRDLTEAILARTDLASAYLNEADLNEANLYRADLTKANLYRADLTGANLYEANLYEANLTEAELNNAVLTGADLTGVDLSSTRLTDVWWDEDNPPIWPEGFDPPDNSGPPETN